MDELERFKKAQITEAEARADLAKLDLASADQWNMTRQRIERLRESVAIQDDIAIRLYAEARLATEAARLRAANAEADYWIARKERESK